MITTLIALLIVAPSIVFMAYFFIPTDDLEKSQEELNSLAKRHIAAHLAIFKKQERAEIRRLKRKMKRKVGKKVRRKKAKRRSLSTSF